jgi:selenoprotein W-related protein
LAAAIKSEFGVDPTLIEGGGGIFDVKADGDMVFSKKDVGRFPEDSEVLEQLRARSG